MEESNNNILDISDSQSLPVDKTEMIGALGDAFTVVQFFHKMTMGKYMKLKRERLIQALITAGLGDKKIDDEKDRALLEKVFQKSITVDDLEKIEIFVEIYKRVKKCAEVKIPYVKANLLMNIIEQLSRHEFLVLAEIKKYLTQDPTKTATYPDNFLNVYFNHKNSYDRDDIRLIFSILASNGCLAFGQGYEITPIGEEVLSLVKCLLKTEM
jgi:hypothetical protein